MKDFYKILLGIILLVELLGMNGIAAQVNANTEVLEYDKLDSASKIKIAKNKLLKEAFGELNEFKIDSLLKTGIDINEASIIPSVFYFDYSSPRSEAKKHIKQIELFLKHKGKLVDKKGVPVWFYFYSCRFDKDGNKLYESIQDGRADGGFNKELKHLIKYGMPVTKELIEMANKCGYKQEEKILLEAGAKE